MSISVESKHELPMVIQGGMGVGISDYRLAREVSLAGIRNNLPTLGVISEAATEALMVRRLQNGDQEGHMRLALASFPNREIAEEVLNKYLNTDERPNVLNYMPKLEDIISNDPQKKRDMMLLAVTSSYAEVWLAKNGWEKDGNTPEQDELNKKVMIGANSLEKVQALHLFKLYGQILAGVDYVIMGAGIPGQVPHILDLLAENRPATYEVDLVDPRGKFDVTFDPKEIFPDGNFPELSRPKFIAIVASNTLAKKMARVADGIIIEGPTAGGHNAPSRDGEEEYGEKDIVYLDRIRKDVKIPFWLAGSYGTSEKLVEALEEGATGVQVGTKFAFSDESGLIPDLKKEGIRRIKANSFKVKTSFIVSPTSFPFKVALLGSTLSEPILYEDRHRICELGYLVQFFKGKNEKIQARCPAEPIKAFIKKGGKFEATEGRVCLCSALCATAGYGKKGELPIVTSGDDTESVKVMVPGEKDSYTAEEAIIDMFKEVTPKQLEDHKLKWAA